MTSVPWMEGAKVQRVFQEGTPYTSIVSNASPTVTYLCIAAPGTGAVAGSAEPVWLISKITINGDATYTEWANGDAKTFNKIARDMASYDYS
jgi:hypothetical protein